MLRSEALLFNEVKQPLESFPEYSKPRLIRFGMFYRSIYCNGRIFISTDDLENAVKSSDAAFKGDPLHDYFNNVGKLPPWRRVLRKAIRKLLFDSFIRDMWDSWVREGSGWTIDDGDACISFTDPSKPEVPPRHPFLRRILLPIWNLQSTEEQINRQQEHAAKELKAIEKAIGDRKPEMLCLRLIFTNPKKQGRGYGYTLGRIATDRADELSKPIYLMSSNVKANTKFYNSLGFVTTAEIILGDSNPTWDKPPIVIALMVREPQSRQFDQFDRAKTVPA